MTKMDSVDELIRLNEFMMSLLARAVFKNDDLKAMVIKASKKPNEILRAYNMCDGKRSITDISKKVKISQPALTVAVDKWEMLGIIFKKKRGNEVLPLRLFSIQ